MRLPGPPLLLPLLLPLGLGLPGWLGLMVYEAQGGALLLLLSLLLVLLALPALLTEREIPQMGPHQQRTSLLHGASALGRGGEALAWALVSNGLMLGVLLLWSSAVAARSLIPSSLSPIAPSLREAPWLLFALLSFLYGLRGSRSPHGLAAPLALTALLGLLSALVALAPSLLEPQAWVSFELFHQVQPSGIADYRVPSTLFTALLLLSGLGTGLNPLLAQETSSRSSASPGQESPRNPASTDRRLRSSLASLLLGGSAQLVLGLLLFSSMIGLLLVPQGASSSFLLFHLPEALAAAGSPLRATALRVAVVILPLPVALLLFRGFFQAIEAKFGPGPSRRRWAPVAMIVPVALALLRWAPAETGSRLLSWVLLGAGLLLLGELLLCLRSAAFARHSRELRRGAALLSFFYHPRLLAFSAVSLTALLLPCLGLSLLGWARGGTLEILAPSIWLLSLLFTGGTLLRIPWTPGREP